MLPKKKSRKKKQKKSRFSYFIVGLLIFSGSILLSYFLTYSRKNTSLSKNTNRLPENVPSGFRSFGIDISHHQGTIDWEFLLKENRYDTIVKFVYCKATEGATFVDKCWHENRKKLIEYRLPHGAYHFFTPHSDPIEQAEHFLKHWKDHQLNMPPVLDVEVEFSSNEQLIRSMQKWLQLVEKKSGYRPVIYTSLHFYKTKFKDEFKGYKFWIASYNIKGDFINDERIIHWQFTKDGHLPGINNNVDFNVSKIIL